MKKVKLYFAHYLLFPLAISLIVSVLMFSCKKDEEIPETPPPPCDECSAFTGKFDLVKVRIRSIATLELIWVTVPSGSTNSGYLEFQQDYKVIYHQEGTTGTLMWGSEDYLHHYTRNYEFINDSMISIAPGNTAIFYPYPITVGSTVDSIIYGARIYHR